MWADFFFEYRMVVNTMPQKVRHYLGAFFLKLDLKRIYGFSDGDQLGH